MAKAIKRVGIIFLALAIICLLAVGVLIEFINPTKVFALTTDKFNTAYLAGGGEELWNSSTKYINAKVLDDINQMIFGENDPVSYIKGSAFLESQTQAQVVPAATINSTIKTKTNNTYTNGMLVTLGGKQWIAASVTLADVGTTAEEKDNVVLTLYLANAEGSSEFTYKDSVNTSGVGDKGDNMYSSSHLRYGLLHDDKWSLFNTTKTDGDSFAQQFLVQPKNIKYQQTQSAYGRYYGDGYNSSKKYPYRWLNDSLNDSVNQGSWNPSINEQGPYVGSYTYNDETGTAQRYDAWGEDYIWIPSWTETGDTTYVNNGRSIWDLSNDQLAHSTTNSYTWWRSSSSGDYYYAYTLYSSGARNRYRTVTESLGVRPAIHLNLTATMEKGIILDNNSTYDYIYKSKENLRQHYAKNGYKHGVNDMDIATINGEQRYVLGNILPNTSLESFINNLKNDNVLLKIYDTKGDKVFDGILEDTNKNILVATGFKVELYETITDTIPIDTVYLSVLGDVVADGVINTLDVTFINRIARGNVDFESLSLERQLAAMVDNKGKVTSTDGKILLNVIGGNLVSQDYFENVASNKDNYQLWNLKEEGGKLFRESIDITTESLVNNAIIGNISPETTAVDFKTKLASQLGIDISAISVHKSNGAVANDNEIIGTGYYINYESKTIYLSVLGDLTGDGRVNTTDVTYLNRLVNGSIILDTSNIKDKLTMLAATIQNKGKLTTADSETIWNYVGGNVDIKQYF